MFEILTSTGFFRSRLPKRPFDVSLQFLMPISPLVGATSGFLPMAGSQKPFGCPFTMIAGGERCM
jgi:hypothetical protein